MTFFQLVLLPPFRCALFLGAGKTTFLAVWVSTCRCIWVLSPRKGHFSVGSRRNSVLYSCAAAAPEDQNAAKVVARDIDDKLKTPISIRWSECAVCFVLYSLFTVSAFFQLLFSTRRHHCCLRLSPPPPSPLLEKICIECVVCGVLYSFHGEHFVDPATSLLPPPPPSPSRPLLKNKTLLKSMMLGFGAARVVGWG